MSWIDVTERLPEKYQDVLVAVKHTRDDGVCHYGVYYLIKDGGWINAFDIIDYPYLVTHWQPIEPPINLQIKGEDDE